jgi:hypothetical protein
MGSALSCSAAENQRRSKKLKLLAGNRSEELTLCLAFFFFFIQPAVIFRNCDYNSKSVLKRGKIYKLL